MTKRVYFIRHGEADWPDWKGPDDARPLTKHGRSEVKRVAKLLCRMGAEPRLIFTSPLPRAAQTAEILAKHLCLASAEAAVLGKGFNAAEFQRLVATQDVDEIVIVGHEPDLSRVLATLTGGRVKLAKAGVALVEIDANGRKGLLRWLFPPRFAKRD